MMIFRAVRTAMAVGKRRRGLRHSGRSFALIFALAAAPFTTFAQQAPVNLGRAGDFVVLSKTGITNVPPSPIVGNVGASPITGAAVLLTCAEVTGTITVVDAAGPAPCSVVDPVGLGVAIGNMQTAYADAAGRTVPDFTELYGGNLSGKTLVPGLYKWSTGVLVDSTGFTLSGGPNAVWIFQVAGDINLANNAHVTLAGGARPVNIFWQVAGPTGVTLGTGTTFSGNILSAKQVILNTGAALNGRALAETQVTLQSTTVTTPGTLVGGVPQRVAPTVTSTVPANLSTGVPIGNLITATFSEAMDPATITGLTFTLKAGLTSVPGTVSYVGLTATFTPAANLLSNTLYTGTVTTGAKDPAGVALASDYVWTFTTGLAPDITRPTVSSTVPALGAVGVCHRQRSFRHLQRSDESGYNQCHNVHPCPRCNAGGRDRNLYRFDGNIYPHRHPPRQHTVHRHHYNRSAGPGGKCAPGQLRLDFHDRRHARHHRADRQLNRAVEWRDRRAGWKRPGSDV